MSDDTSPVTRATTLRATVNLAALAPMLDHDRERAAAIASIASLIRSNARQATPGKWAHRPGSTPPSRDLTACEGRSIYPVARGVREADAMHLTRFGSPAVAIAIAGWLDDLAQCAAQMRSPLSGVWPDGINDAVAVCRAYLGGAR